MNREERQEGLRHSIKVLREACDFLRASKDFDPLILKGFELAVEALEGLLIDREEEKE